LVVLLKQVGEGGAGQFLKALAGLTRDSLDGLPRLVIELHALSRHAGSVAP
jgi:hypothetical protein